MFNIAHERAVKFSSLRVTDYVRKSGVSEY